MQRSAIAFVLSFVGFSSAFAMGMIQKSEPMNGFTRGENPEWMTISTDSKDFDMRHREYQRNAEAERVLWLRTHEGIIGTTAYAGAKREFHQHRNLMHRLWILQQTKGMRKGGSMVKVRMTEPDVQDVDLTPATSIPARAFTGNSPSRRAIVRSAEDRNKIRATIVGH